MDEAMATLQAIRHAVELVDAKVTGIEQRMDKLEQRMDKLEQGMDKLELRVHTGFLDLGRKIDSKSEDIPVLDEMYGRHERQIRRLQCRA